MTAPLFGEIYNLWVMMHQTTDAMWAAREKELKEINKSGLSIIEFGVLFFIQVIERTNDRKATATEISRWLFRKRNSVSELASRMEKKGLVRKARDSERKSVVRITMTDRGRQLYQQAMAEGQFVSAIMSSLSEEERQQLWLMLGKLRNIAFKNLEITQKLPFLQLS
jgi:DNA-binding MarR family transcriptional regulator